LQLADRLRDRITSGEFAPNQRLPSIRTLSQQYGLSEKTVRRGLAVLEEENRVYARRTRGMFVSPR
jgi:DNA-binding GntR family transcriptional regulator